MNPHLTNTLMDTLSFPTQMWMNVQFRNWTVVLYMHTAWIHKDLTHVPVMMGIMTSILHSQEQIAWVRKDLKRVEHFFLSNIKIEFESSSFFLLLLFWRPSWMFLVTHLFFKGVHTILFCLWSPITLKGPKIQLSVFFCLFFFLMQPVSLCNLSWTALLHPRLLTRRQVHLE